MFKHLALVLLASTLARAGGAICEMGGEPRIETPGLVEMAKEGNISAEHLDRVRELQERLGPRINEVAQRLAWRPERTLSDTASLPKLVWEDMRVRMSGVCFVLSPRDYLFDLATKGYRELVKTDHGYEPTGNLKPCPQCDAVYGAIYTPWTWDGRATLDGRPMDKEQLPEARAAEAWEVNEVLAAWKEGLRAALSPSEWEALQDAQRLWLERTIVDVVGADPRVSHACEECGLKLKCEICACVRDGVERAKKHNKE